MTLLVQFAFRLAFGLALCMALVPPRLVSSGYFRVHSYVLLGLNAVAAAVAWMRPDDLLLWPAAAGMAAAYLASAFWLYERPRLGIAALLAVAGLALYGALFVRSLESCNGSDSSAASILFALDPAAGGLLLGSTMAAMLLGHWYLNAPGMKLAPLRRLILLMAAAILFRAAVSGCGLAVALAEQEPAAFTTVFLALRWLAGVFAAAALAAMTWQTLKVPNTQSATGILYVAVIVTFIGELAALLLTPEMGIPV